MATKASKRVMDQRKRDYHRVSFVVEKNMKHLIHAQAIREGVSDAEMMRRAILARCGLEKVPSDINLESMKDVETREQAAAKIIDCQTVEFIQRDVKRKRNKHWIPITPDTVVILPGATKDMIDEYFNALLDVQNALEDMDISKEPQTINISHDDVVALQRLLSNIEIIEDNKVVS